MVNIPIRVVFVVYNRKRRYAVLAHAGFKGNPVKAVRQWFMPSPAVHGSVHHDDPGLDDLSDFTAVYELTLEGRIVDHIDF